MSRFQILVLRFIAMVLERGIETHHYGPLGRILLEDIRTELERR